MSLCYHIMSYMISFYHCMKSLCEVIKDPSPIHHHFEYLFECSSSVLVQKSVFTVSSSVCSLVPLIYILKPLPVLLTVKKADKAILEILPS